MFTRRCLLQPAAGRDRHERDKPSPGVRGGMDRPDAPAPGNTTPSAAQARNGAGGHRSERGAGDGGGARVSCRDQPGSFHAPGLFGLHRRGYPAPPVPDGAKRGAYDRLHAFVPVCCVPVGMREAATGRVVGYHHEGAVRRSRPRRGHSTSSSDRPRCTPRRSGPCSRDCSP